MVAVNQECVDGHIKILKDCLRWRFIVPKGWWLKSDYNISLTVCILGDQIRDIFYDNGFKLEDERLKEMMSNFKSGCLVNYRKACEKYLHSSDYISVDNEMVMNARDACGSVAETQEK